ncbi:MAG: efflux RND transporter periplasmic adaptor subunit, partial [Holosporales bacterium]|nr:efflux RND transporter periplasmic adaptor subunit [Holosporales bacterium]
KIENAEIDKIYRLSLSAQQLAVQQQRRAELLRKQGLLSQKESDTVHQTLLETEKTLARAQIDCENMLVKAPFDGVLGTYKTKDGAQVSVGTSLATFYNPETLLVEFAIPSQYIAKVHLGQLVTIQGQSLALKYVQQAIDEETRMCPASVEIFGASGSWVIGSSVEIKLTVEEKSNVLIIPRSAIFLRGGKDVVYVVGKDNIIEERSVLLGISDRERIEVTSGLSEKEVIVAIGQDRLYPGISVKMTKSSSSTADKKTASL